MKRKWEEPRAEIHDFTANEYISACWGVACSVGKNGNYGKYDWSHWGGYSPSGEDGNSDHSGACSIASNNQFNVTNGVVSFYAENNDQQGSLNGAYTGYEDRNGNGTLDAGDIVFWYTNDGSGSRRWCHWGEVVNADSHHPNRS